MGAQRALDHRRYPDIEQPPTEEMLSEQGYENIKKLRELHLLQFLCRQYLNYLTLCNKLLTTISKINTHINEDHQLENIKSELVKIEKVIQYLNKNIASMILNYIGNYNYIIELRQPKSGDMHAVLYNMLITDTRLTQLKLYNMLSPQTGEQIIHLQSWLKDYYNLINDHLQEKLDINKESAKSRFGTLISHLTSWKDNVLELTNRFVDIKRYIDNEIDSILNGFHQNNPHVETVAASIFPEVPDNPVYSLIILFDTILFSSSLHMERGPMDIVRYILRHKFIDKYKILLIKLFPEINETELNNASIDLKKVILSLLGMKPMKERILDFLQGVTFEEKINLDQAA